MTPLAPTVLKSALRAELRRALAALTVPEREQGSTSLSRRLQATPEFLSGGPAMAFIPLPSEPDLRPALIAAFEHGRTIVLPRWNTAQSMYEAAVWTPHLTLVLGPYGVPEPPPEVPSVAMERLDLVLVPGLAFDREGRRLGRGKGFFDRLLARARSARRWGIAFDLQVVPEVPSEAHDVNVDLLATPSHWIPVNRAVSS